MTPAGDWPPYVPPLQTPNWFWQPPQYKCALCGMLVGSMQVHQCSHAYPGIGGEYIQPHIATTGSLTLTTCLRCNKTVFDGIHTCTPIEPELNVDGELNGGTDKPDTDSEAMETLQPFVCPKCYGERENYKGDACTPCKGTGIVWYKGQ